MPGNTNHQMLLTNPTFINGTVTQQFLWIRKTSTLGSVEICLPNRVGVYRNTSRPNVVLHDMRFHGSSGLEVETNLHSN